MNKVTTINLSGRAFQMEERAYEKLHAYLQSARHELANDPDKDEVMQDFEQAIAEKCDQLLSDHKNVVTTSEIENIIASMGNVDAGANGEKPKAAPASQGSAQPPKRLYLLKDGAIIGGVCNGLAAYFNVDVTIVRLVFVVLAFVTSGFWVLVYLLMMLVVPEAVSPEQKAELRGERFTAQDVIDRAKQKYSEVRKDLSEKEHWRKVGKDSAPALQAAGAVTRKIVQIIFGILASVFAITVAVFTCGWIALLWWLVMGGLHLTDQLQTIPIWAFVLFATTTYLVLVLPLILLTKISIRLMKGRQLAKRDIQTYIVAACMWVLSLGVLMGLGAVYQARIYDYQQNHAYLDVNGHHVCINDDLCDTDANPVPPDVDLPIRIQPVPY